MKHEILFLGKIKDTFISAGVDEYISRIRHYTSVDIRILKEKSRGRRKDAAIHDQGELLLQAVPGGAYTIVLDSRGQQFESEAFAKKIEELELRGIKQASYLIGGPDGLSPAVVNAADLVLSISKMTFTHDMIRLLLAEQLYRAYTILAGEKYHK